MRLNRLKICFLIFSFFSFYLLAKIEFKSYPLKSITFEGTKESSIIYLFVHGLGATGYQAKRYQAIMTHGAIAYFDFPDAKPKPDDYHRSLANLGQEKDIERLKQVYDIIEKEHSESSIILVGVSRGAVTILNFMALYKPKKVKAIVVESPFDTHKSIINHLVDSYLSWLSWMPGLHDFGKKIFKLRFPAFNPRGILPINQIENLPKIPTLFIHSHSDELIPVSSSKKLCNKINQRGNVHLVTVKGARHAHLIVHDACKQDYENAVHAFYKKYDLPYDNQKAELGKTLLD